MTQRGKEKQMLTWVPSKKALEKASALGIVLPDDWQTKYNLPCSATFAAGEVPFVSLLTLATQGYRHGQNNVIASAVLAAAKKAEEDNEDFDPSSFADEKRMAYIADIMNGRLGIRTPSEVIVETDLEKEARDRAFDEVKDFLNSQGATFNYKNRDKRSLAWETGNTLPNGEAETAGSLIDRILGEGAYEKPNKRGRAIWAEAQETLDKRAADKAAATSLFDEDEDEDEAAE
jgi:hypothetical protein